MAGPDEHGIWNALFGTEAHLASNSPQATAFLSAWRSADASLPRQGRMYRALMAAQRGAPHSALPPPPPPSALTGSDAFASLFGSLIDKATAVGCALRRINPQERSYNDNAAVNAGMFDGDLVRWLDVKVDEGSINRTAAANVAGDLTNLLRSCMNWHARHRPPWAPFPRELIKPCSHRRRNNKAVSESLLTWATTATNEPRRPFLASWITGAQAR